MAAIVLGGAPAGGGEPPVLKLWPAGAPLAKGEKPADSPEITIHRAPAEKANGAAVVICPGGGYGALMMSYEGHDVAKWLNGFGIAGIVLKYRVAPYRHPAPLLDAQRALRLTRLHAGEWGLDANRIGIMGFSAGGHLAATLGTHFDAGNAQAADPAEHLGCRPDFLILIYPVISMGAKGHAGSRAALLGPDPAPADVASLSTELQVTAQTPPAFLAHSVQDKLVAVENSRMFAAALQAKGVAATYFELPKGEHGLGCGKGEDWTSWQRACAQWLASRGLVSAAR